jgi:hypothetical protein
MNSSFSMVAAAFGAALLLGVPAAQAANQAPNPSFETACMLVPCNWAGQNATLLHYPVSPHTGAASMRVISDGSSTIVQARSDCLTDPVTAGTTYNLRLWYLASPPVTVNQITYGATFYSGAGCTGSSAAPAGASTSSPVIDGMWHLITGQTTATTNPPFNAVSARLQINFACGVGTCPNTNAVQYDDVLFDSEPLAVTVSSFTARRAHRGVVVRWRTGAEIDTLGFNVYRQRGERRVRLNKRLIPALTTSRGGVRGGAYSFVDRRAPKRAVRYWLQDVDGAGVRTWHGPVRVRAS